MCDMHGMKLLYGFHFNDEAIVDTQIKLQVVVEALLSVDDGHALLDFDKQVICDEFNDHAVSVHRFEKTRTELGVYRDPATDDRFGKFVDQHAGSISRKRSAWNCARFRESVSKQFGDYAAPAALADPLD